MSRFLSSIRHSCNVVSFACSYSRRPTLDALFLASPSFSSVSQPIFGLPSRVCVSRFRARPSFIDRCGLHFSMITTTTFSSRYPTTCYFPHDYIASLNGVRLFSDCMLLFLSSSDAQSCPPTHHPAPPPGPGNQLARSKPKNTMKTQFTKILTSHPSIPMHLPGEPRTSAP
jgi:hypothetical protein